LVLTDAYKCFDRLWLKDCLVDMYEAGAREKEIAYIYRLNRQCEIIINTPVGETNPIEIGEIVKQGTVLEPQMCCASTLKVKKLGPTILTSLSPNLHIGGLTYVDDIAGMGSERVAENTLTALKTMEELKRFTFSTKKTNNREKRELQQTDF